MKKIIFFISLLILSIYSINVNAKDTVISMNKYKEETFNYINDSYDIEGKKDGKIVGGTILFKKETDEDIADYRVIVVKYNKDNKIEWKYIYTNVTGNYIDSLNYTYDSNGKIDGYLVTMHNSLEESITNFVKLSLDGKFVSEKALALDDKTVISKVKETFTPEGIIDGYIAIGNSSSSGYLLKLDRDLNVVWSRQYQDFKVSDVEKVIKDNNIVGYVVVRKANSANTVELIRFNTFGEEPVVIKNDLAEENVYHLEEAIDGFIIYGDTTEVKLKSGNTSYYLINYNSNNENYWETIGDVSINKERIIKLLPIKKNNQLKEYLLTYSTGGTDTNLEVVKIGLDGEIKNKIKKIQDEYYSIKDFMFENDILYLVGQINCPKDDTCEYDSNSLLLVSDEEKVIEVKDNDSRNILIVTGIFIIMIVGTVIYRRKKLNTSK